ncbi:hypothetical protein [Natronococcus wangiae]|uniref:hypothetical protein n=1 Tax=Natronococcus wangiae TaxID=3068275 RepID=UPI002740059E|nr:hypothetical protein [Natronococcus sp. AD5]
MGWNGEKQLAEHSEEHPELAVDYGFVDDSTEKGYPKPPAQSRLWEMFREEFNDELQAICRL